MGQQQSNIKEEVKDKYNIIRNIAPGEYLVKGRKKGEELQLRIMNFLVEDEMTQYTALLEKRRKIKNPHLLDLIQYSKVVDQLMCSSTFKLKIISELPFKTIKDDLRERNATTPRKFFEEDELWSILYSCCHALYSLYINKFPHESLTTQQIYIDTDGIIKVADSLLVQGTKNYLSLMNQDLKLQDIRYISPELRNLVDDNNFYQYEREKSDVYILAMIVLEISNLASLKYFDPKTKRFHFEVVQTAFNQFKERYSPKLCEILNRMITADYNVRPNFQEIIESIQEKTFHTNSNLSSKDSTIILQTIKPNPQNGKAFLPPDLNPVRQKLNFDERPVKNLSQPSQPLSLNDYTAPAPLYSGSFNNPLPPPLVFPSFSNKPQLVTTSYEIPPPLKLPNSLDWKFDSVTKEVRKQNEHNYTPYQQLMNLSGNASIPKDSQNPIRHDSLITNRLAQGLTKNMGNIKNQPIPDFNQDRFMKERRFSQSKFGGIELNHLPVAQVTEKKQVKNLQKFSSFTEAKPLAAQLFKKDKPEEEVIVDHGIFVIQENGSGRYEGFKQNNQKNGIGRIIYTDGGSYQGQWRNDKMDGYGKLFYPNGKTAYQGYWVEDEFNGTGRVYNEVSEEKTRKSAVSYLDFSDIEDKWEYYEGQFSHDLRSGKGMIKFVSGEKYYGSFKQDVIEGEGTFHKNDGDVIQGLWRNNAFVNV